MKFSDLVIIQGSRAQVRMKFSVVTEVSTFLIITQVSSSWKKSHMFSFLANVSTLSFMLR